MGWSPALLGAAQAQKENPTPRKIGTSWACFWTRHRVPLFIHRPGRSPEVTSSPRGDRSWHPGGSQRPPEAERPPGLVRKEVVLASREPRAHFSFIPTPAVCPQVPMWQLRRASQVPAQDPGITPVLQAQPTSPAVV